jgi:2-isopropylmalate synthase
VYQASTRSDTQQIYPTSRLLSSIINVDVQPNKAIVGRNAFAHEAGIHQHGVLQHTMTYEIMSPEDIGLNGNRLVLGKHSGRHAIDARCRQMGFRLQPSELDRVYQSVKKLADRYKEIREEALREIVHRVIDARNGSPEPQRRPAMNA